MADDVDTEQNVEAQSPLERAARALKEAQSRTRFVCGDTAGNLDNPDPEVAAIIYLSEQHRCANRVTDRPVLQLK